MLARKSQAFPVQIGYILCFLNRVISFEDLKTFLAFVRVLTLFFIAGTSKRCSESVAFKSWPGFSHSFAPRVKNCACKTLKDQQISRNPEPLLTYGKYGA